MPRSFHPSFPPIHFFFSFTFAGNRSPSPSARNTSPYESRRPLRRRSSLTPPPPETFATSTSSRHRDQRNVSSQPTAPETAAPTPRMRDERLFRDAVPSRRARDQDPLDDFEAKRRRMDDRVTDSSIARRVSGADDVPSSLPEKPVPSPYTPAPAQGDPSRTFFMLGAAIRRTNHLLPVLSILSSA